MMNPEPPHFGQTVGVAIESIISHQPSAFSYQLFRSVQRIPILQCEKPG
jgi:hypothetical protein